MKITTTLFLILLSTSFAFSQSQDKIDSDRPGQSISPLTVGKKVFQVQSGINYLNYTYPNKLSIHSISNATNVRYGLSETLELNSTLGYRANIYNYIEPIKESHTKTGFENLRFGARLNILNKGGLNPKIALNTELLMAMNNNIYSQPTMGYELKAVVKQPITEQLSLTTNLSVLINSNYFEYIYLYTLNSSYSFTDDLFAFAEIYGLLNYGMSINYDGGVGYNINNDLQIDISAGIRPEYEYNTPIWFSEMGISYRFSKKK